MRPASAKAKGRRLQQAVVADLLAAFPHLAACDVRSTSMGANGEDVQLSSAAREAVPFSIECKNQEKLNLWSAIDQCHANCEAGATPLLVVKRNHTDLHAVLPWRVVLDLLTMRYRAAQQASQWSPSPGPATRKRRISELADTLSAMAGHLREIEGAIEQDPCSDGHGSGDGAPDQ